MSFTEEQAKMAAEWWAQYLPGNERDPVRVTMEMEKAKAELEKVKPDARDRYFRKYEIALKKFQERSTTSPEQQAAFVRALTESILQLPAQSHHETGERKNIIFEYHTVQKYGPESIVYHDSSGIKILEDAVKAAGCGIRKYKQQYDPIPADLALFPFDAVMYLFDNGQIHAVANYYYQVSKNGEIIIPEGAVKPVDVKSFDLSSAPLVVADLNRRIVAIASPGDSPQILSYIDEKNGPQFGAVKFGEGGGYVYTDLPLNVDASKIDSQILLNLTPDNLKNLPVIHTLAEHYTEHDTPIDSTDGDIFPIRSIYKDGGGGHYIKRTEAMRVVELKEPLTAGCGRSMTQGKVGDWLLVNEETGEATIVSAERVKKLGCQFYIATPDGVPTPGKIAPGDELPVVRTREELRPTRDAPPQPSP